MLELRTTDERPIHFANGGEWTAIFHDGTGRVALVNEHELEEEGAEYEISYLNTGLQHGAAVPMEGDLFVQCRSQIRTTRTRPRAACR